MSECIAERRRTQGGRVVVDVWHLAAPSSGAPDWRPIRCGGGINAPGPIYDREPTCPECIAIDSPTSQEKP